MAPSKMNLMRQDENFAFQGKKNGNQNGVSRFDKRFSGCLG
jgi:hypothetical protein